LKREDPCVFFFHWRSDNSRCMKEVATGGSSNGGKKVKRFAERVAPVAQTTHPSLASERSAERVAPVAQTTHPTRAGLAWVLNSLVVPPFLRRGNLWGLRGCSIRLW